LSSVHSTNQPTNKQPSNKQPSNKQPTTMCFNKQPFNLHTVLDIVKEEIADVMERYSEIDEKLTNGWYVYIMDELKHKFEGMERFYKIPDQPYKPGMFYEFYEVRGNDCYATTANIKDFLSSFETDKEILFWIENSIKNHGSVEITDTPTGYRFANAATILTINV